MTDKARRIRVVTDADRAGQIARHHKRELAMALAEIADLERQVGRFVLENPTLAFATCIDFKAEHIRYVSAKTRFKEMGR